MDTLKRFYMDETTRDALLAYLIDCTNQKAVERVMARAETSGVADAQEIIKEAFIALQEQYGDTPKPVTTSSR